MLHEHSPYLHAALAYAAAGRAVLPLVPRGEGASHCARLS